MKKATHCFKKGQILDFTKTNFGKKGQTLNKLRLEKRANYLINSQKFRGQRFVKKAKIVKFCLEKANLATLDWPPGPCCPPKAGAVASRSRDLGAPFTAFSKMRTGGCQRRGSEDVT